MDNGPDERPSSSTGKRDSLEYARPHVRKRFRLFPIVSCVTVLSIAGYFAISFIATAFDPHAGPVNNRVKSQMNLREIGLAMLAYAHDHNHQLPESMGTILANE